MADKKISELPLINTISGSIVYVPIVHDGITEKITVENFSKFTNKYAAQTGSANTFTANQTINANLLVTGDSIISSNATIGGNLVVNGKLTAQEVHTEITSASIIFESGSTIFGNSADDTHQFTGVVSINGVSIGAGVINQFTASQLANDTRMLYITGALNAFTASQIGKDGTLAEVTSSLRYFYQTTSSLHAFTSSQIGKDSTLKVVTSSLNAFTASQIGKDFTLSIVTSSLNNYTSSILGQANTIAVFTSSINAFTGSQLGKDLTLAIITNTSIDAHILKQATQTGSQDLINYNISVVTSSINAHILKQSAQTGSQDLVNYNISVVTSSINAHILKQATQTGSQDLVNYQNSIITSSYRIELNSIEAYTSSLKSAIIVNGSNVQIVGSLDVARLNVQYVSSSVLVTSGSNVFGDQVSDKHEFTGSVNIKDTLFVNGQAIGLGELNAFTGSQIGKDLTLSIVTSSINAHILKQATQTGSQDLVNYNISVVTSSIDAHILKQSAQTGSQDLVNLGISTATGSLIGITNGLMALTASIKNSTIVSSSTQVQNYDVFALNSNLYNGTGSIKGEIAGIEAYTASLKGAAIVSSSQQITNYYKFAETASANTFYGNQSIRGNAIINGGNSVRLYESTNTNYWDTYTYTDNTLRVNYNGAGGDEIILYNDGGINFSGALTASIYKVNNGGGIDFSATTNSSGTMTSELLNDYEEGTWSPTIRGSGTAGTYELATDYTTYTKIGRQVTLNGQIKFGTSVTGGGTGYMQILGAPFTKAANTVATGAVRLVNINFTGDFVTMNFASLSAGTTLFLAETVDNSTPIDLPISAAVANAEFAFTITYFV